MMLLDFARSVAGTVTKAASKIPALEERFSLENRLVGPWPQGPFLWLHGASLGECKMLLSLAIQLQKDLDSCPSLLLTTQKVEVLEYLKTQNQNISYSIAPADTPQTMLAFLKKVKPIGLVLAENELWPGYLSSVRKIALKPSIAIISGRYQRSFSKADFSAIGFVSMQSGSDLSKIAEDLPPEVASNAIVGGNWKLLSWALSDTEIQEPQDPSVDTTFLSMHFSEWNSLYQMILSSIKRQEAVVLVPRRLTEIESFRNELIDQEILVLEWPLVQKGAVSLVTQYGRSAEVLQKSKTAVVGGSFNRLLGVHDFWEPLQYGVPTCIGPYARGQKNTVKSLVHAGVLAQIRSTADYSKRDIASIELIQSFLSHERTKIKNSYQSFLSFLKNLIPGRIHE
ncbi:MAG: 3-deoxy-D-manno-octulosonic acid transferase [Fibrobacter sp.]|jgi:3-deoxy-D-manno-octulosonic-acid transferase|nr:3-deoxy-D-manno-octulosonic acid transferase [Fibrobacter sp.]